MSISAEQTAIAELEMEMNLTSRNRKKASVTGVEEMKGGLGWPGSDRKGG